TDAEESRSAFSAKPASAGLPATTAAPSAPSPITPFQAMVMNESKSADSMRAARSWCRETVMARSRRPVFPAHPTAPYSRLAVDARGGGALELPQCAAQERGVS